MLIIRVVFTGNDAAFFSSDDGMDFADGGIDIIAAIDYYVIEPADLLHFVSGSLQTQFQIIGGFSSSMAQSIRKFLQRRRRDKDKYGFRKNLL